MSLREKIKKILPSYRAEKRMTEKLNSLEKDLREMSKKNEYLFWMSQMQPGETMEDTKARVFLQMPKATGRLRTIQLAENYILQRTKKICDENGLQFFLIGGTLLGAVRHHGFIPWDNDIDIGMMKEDFTKLKEILKQDQQFVLDNYYKYSDGLKIAKIKFRNNEVFFVDVFVFDYLDASPETAAAVWKETQRANAEYSKMLRKLSEPYAGQKLCRPEKNRDLDMAAAAFESVFLKQFSFMGRGEYFCQLIECPYWSRDPLGLLNVQDYMPLERNAVEFEGMKYDVWRNYQKALNRMYGDFFSMPFSISEPHTTEFDEGFDEAVEGLTEYGVILERKSL